MGAGVCGFLPRWFFGVVGVAVRWFRAAAVWAGSGSFRAEDGAP